MKQSKWLRTGLAVMLGATLVAPTSAMATDAVTTTMEQAKAEVFNVTVDVKDVTGKTIATGPIEVKEDNTALQALENLLTDSKVTYTVVEQEWGKYVSSINEVEAGYLGHWDGWMYSVNDESPQVGMDSYELKKDDKLAVYYQASGTITSSTIIEEGAVNPSVTVKAQGDLFDTTVTDTALWEMTEGSDLTIASIEKNSDTEVTIKFTGEAKKGPVKIGVNPKVYMYNKDNTYGDTIVTVKVEGPSNFIIDEETKIATMQVASTENEMTATITKETLDELLAKDVKAVTVESKFGTASYPAPLLKEIGEASDLTVKLEKVSDYNYKYTSYVTVEGKQVALPITKHYATFTLPAGTKAAFRTADNNALVYKLTDSNIVFYTKTSSLTIVEVDSVAQFKDTVTSPNNEYIQELANLGIVKGIGENYMPYNNVTRAQFALMTARALGLVAVNEVAYEDSKNIEASSAIQALAEAGITTGVNGKFKPNDTISREHAAVFVARVLRYADAPSKSATLDYKDLSKINSAYHEDVALVKAYGIMTGAGENFNPNAKLTREQLAKVLYKTLEAIELK